MPSNLNELFGNVLGTLIYLTGIVLLAVLLISANTNYHKNRSYSIGAIFIVSMIFIRHAVGALSADSRIEFVGFWNTFLVSFGLIMTGGIIFFIIMSGIRMIIERIQ